MKNFKVFLYICLFSSVLITQANAPSEQSNNQDKNLTEDVISNKEDVISNTEEEDVISSREKMKLIQEYNQISKNDVTNNNHKKHVKSPISGFTICRKLTLSILFTVIMTIMCGFFLLLTYDQQFIKALKWKDSLHINIVTNVITFAIITLTACCIDYITDTIKIFKKYIKQRQQIAVNNTLNLIETDANKTQK